MQPPHSHRMAQSYVDSPNMKELCVPICQPAWACVRGAGSHDCNISHKGPGQADSGRTIFLCEYGLEKMSLVVVCFSLWGVC